MPFNNIVPGLEIAYSVIDDIRGDDSESQDDERLLPVSSNPEDLGQDSDDEVVENRPQRSPYASDIVALRFSPSQTLRIPRQFLEKTPLAARCEPLNEINLESIQFDAGHVIVNFLVTGRYQCLEPWASTAAGKYSSEFRTALRVYMAAESLGLMDLLKVAQEEVKKAGDKLGFPQVVDNVHFLDPFHAHFPWIGEYIQSRMVSFLESTTIEQATKMTSDVLGPSNLHKILIGGLLKMKASGWERQRGSTISTDRISKVNTSVKDMRKMLREEREKLSASRSTMDLIDPTDAMGLRSRKPDVQGPNPRLHQPQPSMPKVTFVPESRRSMKEVENEAVSEQAELRTLLSKRLDSEETPLGFSWSDQNRLNLLKLKGERRAEVLAAERAWCQIEQKDEEAEAAFKNAVRNEGIFLEVWERRHSNLVKVTLFRALRKKYHMDKLEALAQRRTAAERYQSSTLEFDDLFQGRFSETMRIEDGSCSSQSTGQNTPDSSSESGTAGMCLEPESHLKVGGDWQFCLPCRMLVTETISEMISMRELEVEVD